MTDGARLRRGGRSRAWTRAAAAAALMVAGLGLVPRGAWATPEGVTLAVIGDFGTGTPAAALVASMIVRWDPDHVVTLGDNVYRRAGGSGTGRYDVAVGRDYCPFLHEVSRGPWCDGGAATENRFWPALGNHDYLHGGLATYREYFALPGNERYYDVTMGPIHLFVVDSHRAMVRERDRRAQAAWLRSAMAASTAPWQVVVFHHPPFASSLQRAAREMRWPFAEWGADLVIAGHDHFYERIRRHGLTYLVNGLGGAAVNRFAAPIGGSRVRYNGDRGALRLVATQESLDVTFVSIAGGGSVVDGFRLAAG